MSSIVVIILLLKTAPIILLLLILVALKNVHEYERPPPIDTGSSRVFFYAISQQKGKEVWEQTYHSRTKHSSTFFERRATARHNSPRHSLDRTSHRTPHLHRHTHSTTRSVTSSACDKTQGRRNQMLSVKETSVFNARNIRYIISHDYL